jgi:hypothetical protein
MTGRPPSARRRNRRAAAWTAIAILGSAASAQSTSEGPKPIGFPAGPFVIAPSLTTGYSYDTNVFHASDEASPPPSADQVLRLEPALALTVPFSNSSFRFGDVLTFVDYKNTPQTAGRTSNDAVASLDLNFGSLDKLDLSAHHVAGVAETQAFDPGGSVAFQGNSYRLHNESVSVSREIEGARGYRVSLQRNVLKFEPSPTVVFFDYSGFEGEVAYLQPLSPNTRLAFGYLGTRYDHFDNSPGSDPNAPPFRTENGDTVYAQVEGSLGLKQPYRVRVGWEELAFAGNKAKDFSGLVGEAALSVIVGGGTEFTVTAHRQPYRAFFEDNDPSTEDNNFYVFEELGMRVERPFPQGSFVGGAVSFSRNSYEEPATPPLPETLPILRQDRIFRLEAYANLALRDRIVFRVSILKDRRYSNFPGVDYNDTVVFGGFVFGWI